MPVQRKLDEIDINIVRTLQSDARTSFADIAKDCGVSTDTISKRVKKLKSTGIIGGATVLVNPRSFGYSCITSLGVDVDFPHVREVVRLIEESPDVVFCSPSMGKHSVFAIAILKNVAQLNRVKESIRRHPAVSKVTTSIWVDEISLCPANFELGHLKKE